MRAVPPYLQRTKPRYAWRREVLRISVTDSLRSREDALLALSNLPPITNGMYQMAWGGGNLVLALCQWPRDPSSDLICSTRQTCPRVSVRNRLWKVARSEALPGAFAGPDGACAAPCSTHGTEANRRATMRANQKSLSRWTAPGALNRSLQLENLYRGAL